MIPFIVNPCVGEKISVNLGTHLKCVSGLSVLKPFPLKQRRWSTEQHLKP